MGVLQRLTGEWGGKLEEAAHREARRAEGRKMLHSAPQRRREGGGRRRTAPGFQPGMPAGCATQTGWTASGRAPANRHGLFDATVQPEFHRSNAFASDRSRFL